MTTSEIVLFVIWLVGYFAAYVFLKTNDEWGINGMGYDEGWWMVIARTVCSLFSWLIFVPMLVSKLFKGTRPPKWL